MLEEFGIQKTYIKGVKSIRVDTIIIIDLVPEGKIQAGELYNAEVTLAGKE